MRLPKIIAALFAEPSPLRVPMIYRVSALRNCLLSLGLACLALTAWAAVGGRLSGSITDGSGALISQARVTVTNVETGVTQSSQTDNRGFYSFEDLPVAATTLKCIRTVLRTTRSPGLPFRSAPRSMAMSDWKSATWDSPSRSVRPACKLTPPAPRLERSSPGAK